MSVRATLNAGPERLPADNTAAAAHGWLERTAILLEWIAAHPQLVEIRRAASRLFTECRGGASAQVQR